MHIAVLGAGVVGLPTAWLLVRKGFRVTIIDRQKGVGQETSFANGAQLSYAYVAPLASPGILAKLPSLLISRDSPLAIKPSFDPAFVRWMLGFLRACNRRTELESLYAQVQLANLSRDALGSLLPDLPSSVLIEQPGKLVIFRSAASFRASQNSSEQLAGLGILQEIASPDRCLELEPALHMSKSELVGGIFTPSEQVSDCHAFCLGLEESLRKTGAVTWHLSTEVVGGVIDRGALEHIITSTGDVKADAYVLCLGSFSAHIAKSLGFYLPIQPLKGFSLTLPVADGGELTKSVTDFDNKTVFAPIKRGEQNKIRVAGVAELVGYDTRIDPKRIEMLRRLAKTVVKTADVTDDMPWTGLRPQTPDSRPIIGPSPLRNLFLNTGHGGLGWTLACGSATLCAELIAETRPSIDPKLFALDRSSL
jgi:D-amino-acid dehydrogenase